MPEKVSQAEERCNVNTTEVSSADGGKGTETAVFDAHGSHSTTPGWNKELESQESGEAASCSPDDSNCL